MFILGWVFSARWSACLFGIFALVYVLGLVFRFAQAELYVDWRDYVAACQAVLPYLAGVMGIILAFVIQTVRQRSAR